MDETERLANGTFIEFSQFNGIVCYGEVIERLALDRGIHAVLVKYHWDPDGDPPRRPYRLVDASKVRVITRKPNYVTSTNL